MFPRGINSLLGLEPQTLVDSQLLNLRAAVHNYTERNALVFENLGAGKMVQWMKYRNYASVKS